MCAACLVILSLIALVQFLLGFFFYFYLIFCFILSCLVLPYLILSYLKWMLIGCLGQQLQEPGMACFPLYNIFCSLLLLHLLDLCRMSQSSSPLQWYVVSFPPGRPARWVIQWPAGPHVSGWSCLRSSSWTQLEGAAEWQISRKVSGWERRTSSPLQQSRRALRQPAAHQGSTHTHTHRLRGWAIHNTTEAKDGG